MAHIEFSVHARRRECNSLAGRFNSCAFGGGLLALARNGACEKASYRDTHYGVGFLVVAAIATDFSTLPRKTAEIATSTIATSTDHGASPTAPAAAPAPLANVRPPASTPPKKPAAFPANPIDLLTFSPTQGGVFKNRSSEILFVSAFTTSVAVPQVEESTSYLINKEVKSGEDSHFNPELPGVWETVIFPGDDWNSMLLGAINRFGGCVLAFPYPYDSPILKQIINHYRSMNKTILVGDAKGTFSYRRGSTEREQVIALKAILFLKQDCHKAN
jgi:hypothetical protein